MTEIVDSIIVEWPAPRSVDAAPLNLAEVSRIAAAYPPEAAQTSREERQRFFTDAQRAAWDLRFSRTAQLNSQHG